MYATCIFIMAFIFPMERHSTLVGKTCQQMMIFIEEILADIKGINGFNHITLIVIFITHKFNIFIIWLS